LSSLQRQQEVSPQERPPRELRCTEVKKYFLNALAYSIFASMNQNYSIVHQGNYSNYLSSIIDQRKYF
jgi:hypothetical protein